MNELHLPDLAPLAAAWAARGWLALLAFTAAVLFVAALRKPCRRWFGAERAFQLWLLPPLALLASQLPHAAAASAALPPLVYTITSAAGTVAPQVGVASGFDWRVGAMLLWLAGGAAVVVLATLAQRAYRRRLRGATPMADARSRRSVLRATRADVGPALVGAWRSRIVLPADFAERYDTTEQALILAHEDAHAQRGDGWWRLFAQLLAALFWCHPLAWWALAALRHDQELACDAAVLRRHGAQRRSYANAMLKTQSAAFALPVGCAWSPRHPLTERIAMLKQKPTSTTRNRIGSIALVALVGAISGMAYAATAPVVSSQARPATAPVEALSATAPGHYTLELDVSFDGKPASQQQKLCLKPGEYVIVNGVSTGLPPWKGRFAVLPTEKGLIEIRADVSGGTLDSVAHPVVRTALGQKATILVAKRVLVDSSAHKIEQVERGIQLDMTPSIGC